MAIEWPKPWRTIDERRRTYIGRELTWEVSHFPNHPLAKRSFDVVAMMDVYDNAIIQFDDGTFGYVHLSWSTRPPHFDWIGDEGELVRFLHDGIAAD